MHCKTIYVYIPYGPCVIFLLSVQKLSENCTKEPYNTCAIIPLMSKICKTSSAGATDTNACAKAIQV